MPAFQRRFLYQSSRTIFPCSLLPFPAVPYRGGFFLYAKIPAAISNGDSDQRRGAEVIPPLIIAHDRG